MAAVLASKHNTHQIPRILETSLANPIIPISNTFIEKFPNTWRHICTNFQQVFIKTRSSFTTTWRKIDNLAWKSSRLINRASTTGINKKRGSQGEGMRGARRLASVEAVEKLRYLHSDRSGSWTPPSHRGHQTPFRHKTAGVWCL